jgi:hypothetical protein
MVETMERWEIIKNAIIEHNYKLFQMQHSYNAPEGFHAWFWKGNKRVEVATHNKEVQRDIVSSGLS